LEKKPWKEKQETWERKQKETTALFEKETWERKQKETTALFKLSLEKKPWKEKQETWERKGKINRIFINAFCLYVL